MLLHYGQIILLEIVYVRLANAPSNQLEFLKKHFLLFYQMTCEFKFIPDAHFERINAVF